MKYKLCIGLILFLALLGTYTFITRQPKQKLVENVIKEVTPVDSICSGLGEDACRKKSACYPTYKTVGPNRDIYGMPLLNSVFDICLPFSEGEQIQIDKQRTDCLSNGGDWIISYAYPNGSCIISGKKKVEQISVVVTIDMPFTPEPELSPEEIESQRFHIKSTRELILSSLGSRNTYEVYRTFEIFSPSFAIKINKDLLEKLESHPFVKSVQEDTASFYN
ncbi:protease inhibitor I9 family protein [Patescibacteria group bacterium]|nr:protease inhibitor I9 family protein [Patescibacteria group bacterium]